MANEAQAKRFTFTETALAAGVKPKALRWWLDKGQVHLDAEDEREGTGWRRFSVVDAIRIALIGLLVGYCVPVEHSSEIAEDLIRKKLGLLMTYKNTPFDAVRTALMTAAFAVWPEGGSWGYGEPADDQEHFIFINMQGLVDRVFENLGLE